VSPWGHPHLNIIKRPRPFETFSVAPNSGAIDAPPRIHHKHPRIQDEVNVAPASLLPPNKAIFVVIFLFLYTKK
jgi:hypothetical protein